jgi:hypothetical protein
MIGFGTAWCLRRQKQPDSIVHDNAIIHIPICMIQTIEVRDQLRVQDYHAYTCFYAIIGPLLILCTVLVQLSNSFTDAILVIVCMKFTTR